MAQINIQIEGMSLAEAKVVMTALSQAYTDNVDDAVRQASADTAAVVEASKPKLNTLVEQGRANAEAEDDLPGDLGQAGQNPESKAETKPKKPAAKKKPADKPAKDVKNDQTNVVDLAEKREAGGLLEKLSKFTKLVDVISVMREEGTFADDDALISECERIQEQVPALKKISDIPGRVKRVLERLSA